MIDNVEEQTVGVDVGSTDELWTTGQAAAYLQQWGITRRTVSRMVNAGQLGFRRETGKWARVPRGAVEAYGRQLERRTLPLGRPAL